MLFPALEVVIRRFQGTHGKVRGRDRPCDFAANEETFADMSKELFGSQVAVCHFLHGKA